MFEGAITQTEALFYVIIFLVLLLFAKEVIIRAAKKFLGIGDRGETVDEQGYNINQPEWARRLEHHYNHESTAIQQDLESKLDTLKEEQKEMRKTQEHVAENTKKAVDHLEQMRMEGVRVKNGNHKK